MFLDSSNISRILSQIEIDDPVKNRQNDGFVKSSPVRAGLGAQKLRSEAHLQVRRNDEVEAQRRRWTFYEIIKILIAGSDPPSYAFLPGCPFSITDREKFIKGKIDLFFEECNGWVIVDYKTDGVQGKGLKERFESYREQNNTSGP
jgi:ATP-dependent exoDNAse (exonuclease V) beta subunit